MKREEARRKSTGNLFEDLGFNQPEEWKIKAQIAAHVLREIERRGLTQAKAAKLLDISQPEVSNLKTGQLQRFPSNASSGFFMPSTSMSIFRSCPGRRPRPRKL